MPKGGPHKVRAKVPRATAPDPAPASGREALIHIVNVLGPNSFGCAVNTCDGCDYEGNEALMTARRALGIPDGTKLDPRHWPP